MSPSSKSFSELLDLGTQHYKERNFKKAERPLRKAVELLEDAKGLDHKRTLSTKSKFGITLFELKDYDKSAILLKDVADRQTETLGADDKHTLASSFWLARAYFEQKKYEQAEPVFQKVCERRQRLGASDHHLAASLCWLGGTYAQRGKFARAEDVLAKATGLAEEKLGKHHETTSESHHWLGYTHYKQRKYKDAEKAFRKAGEGSERAGGANEHNQLRAAYWLGLALLELKRWSEAEGQLQKATDGYKKTRGSDHTYTNRSRRFLGQALYRARKYSEAERPLQQAVESCERTRETDFGLTIRSHYWLGQTLYKLGKSIEAERSLQKAVDGFKTMKGVDFSITKSRHLLARTLHHQGKLTEAEGPLRKAEPDMETHFGANHEFTLMNRHMLGMSNLHQDKKPDEAEWLLRSSTAGLERKSDPATVCNSKYWLAFALYRQKKYNEAEDYFRLAAELFQREYGEDDGFTISSHFYLGESLYRQKRYREAESSIYEAVERYKKTVGIYHPSTINALRFLEEVQEQVSTAAPGDAKQTATPQQGSNLGKQEDKQPRPSSGTIRTEMPAPLNPPNRKLVLDPRRLREEYTVGWICALPVELAAAEEMLDKEDGVIRHERDDTDENMYILGSIGKHKVVIVCLPAGRIGSSPAAAVVTQMRSTFKRIQFVLMVGIGGGVPSAKADVRLGDVVVGQPHNTNGGVVQYDMGKTTPSGFQRTGLLNMPPQTLLEAVAWVRAKELRDRSKFSEYVAKFEGVARFQRARAGHDILFDATYEHEGYQTCEECRPDKQVTRPQRKSAEEVVVHYGTIASGNQVMRSATERDRVSKGLGGVLCFEMEGAGLMNSFPGLMVRGICDYSDSHKNKNWQAYAAGTAAAWAKALLSVIPAADEV